MEGQSEKGHPRVQRGLTKRRQADLALRWRLAFFIYHPFRRLHVTASQSFSHFNQVLGAQVINFCFTEIPDTRHHHKSQHRRIDTLACTHVAGIFLASRAASTIDVV